jgi:hypothetical protein
MQLRKLILEIKIAPRNWGYFFYETVAMEKLQTLVNKRFNLFFALKLQ